LKKDLTIDLLCEEAKKFAKAKSRSFKPVSYNGKSIGTCLETMFKKHLEKKYTYNPGNCAKGIDFPDLNVDIKVTSITRPQSSCRFESAGQKIYGLGYSLLIFAYEKRGGEKLCIKSAVFLDKSQTADSKITSCIQKILINSPDEKALVDCFRECGLEIDATLAQRLAGEILKNPPNVGRLTMSNALQWRLTYKDVIAKAGMVDGIVRII
jgi:hypothetical protein